MDHRLTICAHEIEIRKYMRRSFDHVDALLELGRDGDFALISSL